MDFKIGWILEILPGFESLGFSGTFVFYVSSRGISFICSQVFMIRTIGFCFLAILAFSCQSLKPLGKQNLAHQYSPGFPIEVKHRILDAGSDFSVFIEIKLKKLAGITDHKMIWDKYQMGYVLTKDYEGYKILAQDSLGPDYRIPPSVNPLVLFLKVPKTGKNRLLAVWVKEKLGLETYYFDIPIREEEKGLYSACLFQKNGRIPVFNNFITSGDTVVLRQLGMEEKDYSLEFHPFNNSIALPPMAAIPTSGHDFDKSYEVKYNPESPMVFKEEGYYFLKTSNEGTGPGFGFLVTQPYFPLVTNPKELAEPMVYISTREERKNVLEASNQKLALDQFWLKINPQKEVARRLIKLYFENIESSNVFFSSHKAGWKTDMGMVYTIYGPPPIVNRDFETEIWQYDKSSGVENTLFYFSRKAYDKNPNVWELKRYNEYDRVWYGVVELWRKGVINR
jgi:GWxTD domain-containing protein